MGSRLAAPEGSTAPALPFNLVVIPSRRHGWQHSSAAALAGNPSGYSSSRRAGIYSSAASHAGRSSAAAGNPFHVYSSAASHAGHSSATASNSFGVFVITIPFSCRYIYSSAASHAGHSSAAAGNPFHAYILIIFICRQPCRAHISVTSAAAGNSFGVFVITIPFSCRYIYSSAASHAGHSSASSRQSFSRIFICHQPCRALTCSSSNPLVDSSFVPSSRMHIYIVISAASHAGHLSVVNCSSRGQHHIMIHMGWSAAAGGISHCSSFQTSYFPHGHAEWQTTVANSITRGRSAAVGGIPCCSLLRTFINHMGMNCKPHWQQAAFPTIRRYEPFILYGYAESESHTTVDSIASVS